MQHEWLRFLRDNRPKLGGVEVVKLCALWERRTQKLSPRVAFHHRNATTNMNLTKSEVLSFMEQDVRWLAKLQPGDGYRWAGNQRELVELVHEVYNLWHIRDDTGRIRTFRSLLADVCRALDYPQPRNPRSIVSHFSTCKYHDELSMVNRYAYILASSAASSSATSSSSASSSATSSSVAGKAVIHRFLRREAA